MRVHFGCLLIAGWMAAGGASAQGVGELRDLDRFKDCDACPEMVVLPAGGFDMGSPEDELERDWDEGPVHRVAVERFALGRTEVTFDQWEACVAEGGCGGWRPEPPGWWGAGDRPVTEISWEDAQRYVAWLNKTVGADIYRLPSEAEWEYAARAGTATPFWFGDSITWRDANYDAEFGYGGLGGGHGRYRRETVEAGALPTNPWGLHEILGNVAEWTADCWNESYEGAPVDGSPWSTGDCDQAVLRGGSWKEIPSALRSASRAPTYRDVRTDFTGFRVARSLPK